MRSHRAVLLLTFLFEVENSQAKDVTAPALCPAFGRSAIRLSQRQKCAGQFPGEFSVGLHKTENGRDLRTIRFPFARLCIAGIFGRTRPIGVQERAGKQWREPGISGSFLITKDTPVQNLSFSTQGCSVLFPAFEQPSTIGSGREDGCPPSGAADSGR